MADPAKKQRDFSAEAQTAISTAWDLSRKEGKWKDAVESLLLLEKQTRNASDVASTTLLVQAIINIAYESGNYPYVLENLQLLAKKHGQFKTSTTAMVDLVIDWLEAIKASQGDDVWLKWISALRTVTEGKIFLETPRARVTLSYALYHEALSNSSTETSPPPLESLQTASDLLGELQVETYSSMELREKIGILLEQMRLLMLVAQLKDEQAATKGGLADGEADWVKMRVGGRKVNETFLNNPENQDVKLKFHELEIQRSLRSADYLDVAKHYHKIWEVPKVQEDPEGLAIKAIENIVCFLILAPYDNEQSDMINRLFIDPALSKPGREVYHALIKRFITPELLRWNGIQDHFGPTLRGSVIFTGPGGDKRWNDLHTRVNEHNIRVISKYYSRITIPGLTSLLSLPTSETEELLSRLVVSGMVWARIDRPEGIVNFRQKRSAEDVMNDWSSDMNRMLGLVDKAWMAMNAEVAARSVGEKAGKAGA